MVRSRVLWLCALALGLMAFAASAAQAETGAHWNVVEASGKLVQIPGTNDLLPQAEIKEIENSTAELLFTTAGGTKVAILCTSAKFDEGGLLQANGGLSAGKILFTGCLTKLNGVTSAACVPKGGGAPATQILTLKGKGLIVLDKLASGEVDDFVKITPESGKLFSKIELGEECAIGEFVNVEAKAAGEGLWIKDEGATSKESNESFLTEKPEHLIVEALQGLIALGQPATIDGKALVRLNGAHLNLKWGGTPA